MPFALWSKIFGNNGNADPNINFQEGQSPSSVNDSARAMMGVLAQYRDDISGSIVTSGTSTAYIVASNSGFDTLAHMNGQVIAFSPHIINGAGSPSVTLNVDGLGAFPIRSAPSVEIASGTLSQGTPYLVMFNNTDSAFYLHGFFGNPYSIPVGASIDFWGATAPNSSFVFPYGQAINRTTYASLFAMFGTAYGAGDGTTTFNIPDLRGRVIGSPDNMGGTDANRLTGSAITAGRNSLGGNGGEGTHLNTLSETPQGLNSAGANSMSPPGGQSFAAVSGGTSIGGVQVGNAASGSLWVPYAGSNVWGAQNVVNGTTSVSSNNTGGAAHNNVQPTILCNRILRVA